MLRQTDSRNFSWLLDKCVFNVCPIREQDGQASGGNDFGSDDWIFTIREKDPKKLQNGEGQSGTDQVKHLFLVSCLLLADNRRISNLNILFYLLTMSVLLKMGAKPDI